MKKSGILAEKGLHVFDSEVVPGATQDTPRIWILVADRQNAHIYRCAGTGSVLQQIASGSAKSGGSHGGRSHDHDPSHSAHHKGDQSFAQGLSDWLKEAVYERVVDRIVLIAPPEFLGRIRGCLDKHVSSHIAAELSKDLINLPEKDIRKHLKGIVGF